MQRGSLLVHLHYIRTNRENHRRFFYSLLVLLQDEMLLMWLFNLDFRTRKKTAGKQSDTTLFTNYFVLTFRRHTASSDGV